MSVPVRIYAHDARVAALRLTRKRLRSVAANVAGDVVLEDLAQADDLVKRVIELLQDDPHGKAVRP